MKCTHFSWNASWFKSLLRDELLRKVPSLIWSLSTIEKLVAEGKHAAIYSHVYSSLTFGNSSQLQHLMSMSSYNRISHHASQEEPGTCMKVSCNESLVRFSICSLGVQRAYTEGSVRLNKFQPSCNWKASRIQIQNCHTLENDWRYFSYLKNSNIIATNHFKTKIPI